MEKGEGREFGGVELRLDLTGRKQSVGRLEAVIPVRSGGRGKGIFWLCRCKCGREREVLAKKFVSEEIKSCVDCRKNPTRRVEGSGRWYPPEFRRSWRGKVAAFDAERRLLYETILDGRTHWLLRMQAADIAIREPDARKALGEFGRKRIILACRRIINQRRDKQ